jgi:hypothetical protein
LNITWYKLVEIILFPKKKKRKNYIVICIQSIPLRLFFGIIKFLMYKIIYDLLQPFNVSISYDMKYYMTV